MIDIVRLEDSVDAKFRELLNAGFRLMMESKKYGEEIPLTSMWDKWAKDNGILEYRPEKSEEYVELPSPWKSKDQMIYLPKDFALKTLVLGLP